MTPEQQNKLEAIKSALRQHIEEAEKATPGTWVIRDYNVYQKQGRHIFDFGPHHTPISEYPKSCLIQDEANAAFIARARTMSPLACKIALAGIECAEQHSALAFVYGIPITETQVQGMIDLWEGGQP